MDIAGALRENGLQSVLIVDDAYETPTPGKIGAQAKGRFVRAVRDNDAGAAQLREQFPELDTDHDDELIGLLAYDEKVVRVWDLYQRTDRSFQWMEPTFREFEVQRALKRAPLLRLEAYVQEQGLPLEMRPSIPEEQVNSYGLIFIDFFLDTDSIEVALERSVAIGKKFAAPREDNGTGRRFRPLVFLISSRAQTTREYQEKFRERSEIKGSFFRFIDKDQLTPERLPPRLERQLANYPSAMLLADYLEVFRKAAITAVDKLQELEPTDLALLNLLRIEAENERLGNYLNWLLSEAISGGIQSSEQTRAAGNRLDQRVSHRLDGHSLDPRNLLFEIYTNAVFRYDVRDVLGEARSSLVTFGDIFVVDEVIEDAPPKEKRFRIRKLLERLVPWRRVRAPRTRKVYLAVLTPTSDILRQKREDKRILCLRGEAAGLGMTNVRELLRTDLSGQEQHLLQLRTNAAIEYRVVKWGKKELQTVELRDLADRKKCVRVARLQPLFAHQLKHVALSDIGRVGVPTSPAIVNVLDAEVVLTLSGFRHELKSKDLGMFAGIVANKRIGEADAKVVAFSAAFLDELRTLVGEASDAASEQDKGKLDQIRKTCEGALAEVEVKERKEIPVGNLVKLYMPDRAADAERKPVMCEIVLFDSI